MRKLNEMTPEERKAFIDGALERSHRAEYNNARIMAGREDLPEWDKLTEEQRENIRAENRRFQREMDDLGKQISQGLA